MKPAPVARCASPSTARRREPAEPDPRGPAGQRKPPHCAPPGGGADNWTKKG